MRTVRGSRSPGTWSRCSSPRSRTSGWSSARSPRAPSPGPSPPGDRLMRTSSMPRRRRIVDAPTAIPQPDALAQTLQQEALGRVVQSVGLRLIVDREHAASSPSRSTGMRRRSESSSKERFEARLTAYQGKRRHQQGLRPRHRRLQGRRRPSCSPRSKPRRSSRRWRVSRLW